MAKAKAKKTRSSNQSTQQQENKLVDLNTYRKTRKKSVDIVPRNVNQETMVTYLENDQKKVIFATGPAGTGKTLLATLWGIKQLKEKKIEKFVITRPNVAVDDRDIGYLPGDMEAKMTPWMMPIFDILEEYYTPEEIKSLLHENIIEICPIAYMRGRTFKNSFVLVDEAQGTSRTALKSTLTRIGENSRMVVTGDVNQTDIGPENGLQDFMDKFQETRNLALVQFERKDVERSDVVKDILDLYGED